MAAIASRVDNLRTERIAADYDLAQLLTQAVARSDVVESRALVADFQALLTTIPAKQIADGARNFLRSIGRIP